MPTEKAIMNRQMPKGLAPERLYTLLEWVHRVGQVECEKTLKHYLDYLQQQIPVEHMCLVVGRINQQRMMQRLDKVVEITYPHNWIEHYIHENYASCDPVLLTPLSPNPLLWQERFSQVNTNQEKRFIAEATSVGLGDGITCSAFSQKHNLACLISLAGKDVSMDRQLVEMVNTLVPHLHQAVIRTTIPATVNQPGIVLSHREHDIFHWMSHGKTNWEIATILDISERTVKFHVANIIRKLNANNRTHAIVLGLQLGIQPPLAANE
ncbi:helix-turn-helix transcriptional regulator [Paludibacterium paludis]|uniref:HTH luxR-type domain-containing protein n=1 Tax=Paludibacterium paludis TaxID=1225769 RepID=A0A918P719_9NEIS|nr:LuxR family transcriptional regulator [Paludibacterium paludis]GGY27724.1 hypothetical protein GCM10011289_33840 [Paludibacterium paludis]